MYRKFEHLEAKLEKELANMDEKFRLGAEMSEGDLKRIDMLAHSSKCLMAFEKMLAEKNGQLDFNYQNSYANGSSYMGNNSYMNNNSYMGGNSYNDGNSQMNSQMGQNYTSRDMSPMSGHYPNQMGPMSPMNQMMPGVRRW